MEQNETKDVTKLEETPETEQQPTSVIMRRQVITTAGTIEENIEEEQIAGEEIVNTSESPEEQEQKNVQIVQYEEQNSEQNYEESGQVYVTGTVITTEGYSTQTDYPQNQYTTLELPANATITTIEGDYAELESVNNSTYSGQYSGNDGTQYIHHQYQTPAQYSTYNVERAESPQTALYRDTDPNLASSRYTVSFFKILYFRN